MMSAINFEIVQSDELDRGLGEMDRQMMGRKLIHRANMTTFNIYWVYGMYGRVSAVLIIEFLYMYENVHNKSLESFYNKWTISSVTEFSNKMQLILRLFAVWKDIGK